MVTKPTTNKPLLKSMESTRGNLSKTLGVKVTLTPKAKPVPKIRELLLLEKSTEDNIEIPAAVMVPNNASVAPPITGLGIHVINTDSN